MGKYILKFLTGYFIKDHYRAHLKRHIKEMLSGELVSVGLHLLLLQFAILMFGFSIYELVNFVAHLIQDQWLLLPVINSMLLLTMGCIFVYKVVSYVEEIKSRIRDIELSYYQPLKLLNPILMQLEEERRKFQGE